MSKPKYNISPYTFKNALDQDKYDEIKLSKLLEILGNNGINVTDPNHTKNITIGIYHVQAEDEYDYCDYFLYCNMEIPKTQQQIDEEVKAHEKHLKECEENRKKANREKAKEYAEKRKKKKAREAVLATLTPEQRAILGM